jgi:soluble lytic murein transglycosylase
LTRHRSALVAVLACASLAAVTFAAEAAATRGGAKSSRAATAKAVGKTATATGKMKVAAGKSKDKKSTADKPVALAVPLAQGPAPQTPEAEVALVKSAIGALRSGGASKATEIAATISDPAARKLVEWIILRSDHNGAHSKRYLAFIAANPSWPNLGMFRRRAEGMLWVENVKPAQALSFFNDSPPQSGVGRLVLARALFAQGDNEGASALVREAWRYDPLPAEVEKHVLERYPELLSRADHKARMEKRLFAADNDAAMRAARRLGGADLAIAHTLGVVLKMLDELWERRRRETFGSARKSVIKC